eukprot:5465458-Prymnesium_polylepis.2
MCQHPTVGALSLTLQETSASVCARATVVSHSFYVGLHGCAVEGRMRCIFASCCTWCQARIGSGHRLDLEDTSRSSAVLVYNEAEWNAHLARSRKCSIGLIASAIQYTAHPVCACSSGAKAVTGSATNATRYVKNKIPNLPTVVITPLSGTASAVWHGAREQHNRADKKFISYSHVQDSPCCPGCVATRCAKASSVLAATHQMRVQPPPL